MKILNFKKLLIICFFVSNYVLSLDLICISPDRKMELISATKARLINTDDFFAKENFTFKAGEERKYKQGKAVTKDLNFCRNPKDSFFIKKSSTGYFVESRCDGGITKFQKLDFQDDLVFERFEWFYERSDLRDLDWDSGKIFLMEDKSLYQIKYQQFNSTNVVDHPLLILDEINLSLEIRDLPEEENSFRYKTFCAKKNEFKSLENELILKMKSITDSNNVKANKSSVPKTNQFLPEFKDKVQPLYPREDIWNSYKRKIEGYVTVQFDIDKNGKAFNIRIKDSTNILFNKSAKEAIRKSTFKVKRDDDDNAITYKDISLTYDFK